MRWALPLIVLGGCNQVFGLERTHLLDGPPGGNGDGKSVIDAPFSCPTPGPPRFSGESYLWGTQSCYGYTTSAGGIAAAECYDTDTIDTGKVGGMLSAGAGLPSRTQFDQPRLSPEGDEMFLHATGSQHSIAIYRLAAGTWSYAGDLPKPGSGDYTASTPSAGPDRRVLEVAGSTIYEYGNTTGTWVDLQRTVDFATLGVTEVKRMDLSPDGLRLVFYGHDATTYGAFYSERAATTGTFGMAVMLPGVPPPPYADPFMTADCARLYYAQDNAMFYVIEQL